MTLTDYLTALANEWAIATGRSLVALGTLVRDDGKFFARLDNGTQPRVSTFEQFLAFFRSGENWPDNVIPLAAADLLDRLENIAAEERASSDKRARNIGGRAARASGRRVAA